jgi:hypothetical protein
MDDDQLYPQAFRLSESNPVFECRAAPRGRGRSALQPGLSGEKNSLCPRAWEILFEQLT